MTRQRSLVSAHVAADDKGGSEPVNQPRLWKCQRRGGSAAVPAPGAAGRNPRSSGPNLGYSPNVLLNVP